MVFSSIEFIFVFLPLFLLTYYMILGRMRNAWLFAGSILFYTLGSIQKPEYVALLVVSLLFNYIMDCLIGAYNNRFWNIMGVGVNLLYLGCFKYLLQTFSMEENMDLC